MSEKTKTKQQLKKVCVPITPELNECIITVRSSLDGLIPGVTLSDAVVIGAAVFAAAAQITADEVEN